MPAQRGTTGPGSMTRSPTGSPVQTVRQASTTYPTIPTTSTELRSGIISRTLSPSPTVRWILSARIRSTSKNDVVFVGENFIQLREFLGNGQLADATAKLDFGARILSAKVISAQLEIIPFLHQVLKQERDELRYIIKGKPVNGSQPPQILVLATTSNEVVYVYAKESPAGNIKFVYAKRRLLGGVSMAESYGKNMAVDSESRALALTPSAGYCAITTLKDVADIKSEIDAWDPKAPQSFKPANEQRFIQIDGFISKMEFLRSTANDPTKIILLLIVANAGRSSLLLYRWDAREPLTTIKPMRCSGQQLPAEDSFPLMLIPSSLSTSFVLVSETVMALYDNVTSLQARRTHFDLPKEDSDTPTGPANQALWVQWAKPARHPMHRQANDDLILVREDGLLRVYLLSHKSSLQVNAHFSPGNLGIHVDTAFCMLAGPLDTGGDVFIAGGDMTDGGVFPCLPREAPVRSQTLPNMAPMHDLILVHSMRPGQTGVNMSPKNERTFIASGVGPTHGFIGELRYGMEAQVGWEMAHPDAHSIDNLWTMESASESKLLILASHSTHTSIVTFDLLTQEIDFADGHSLPGFDYDAVTLAASFVSGDIAVQITQRAVNIVMLSGAGKSTAGFVADEACLCATIDGESRLFAVAIERGHGYEVAIGRFVNDGAEDVGVSLASSRHCVESFPVSICLATVLSHTVCIIGTDCGQLSLCLVEETGLTACWRHPLNSGDKLPHFAIASLQFLGHPSSKAGLILCGQRNGVLVCVPIQVNVGDDADRYPLVCGRQSQHSLGSTTVKITVDDFSRPGMDASAFIVCGANTHRLTLFRNQAGIDYSLSAVFLTKHTDLAYQQPPLNAVHRVPKVISTDGGEPGGLLVAATGNELLFSSLVLQEQPVLRRTAVNGTPRRLTYSKHLGQLVVALEQPTDISSTADQRPSRSHQTMPALQLVDPDFQVEQPALDDRGVVFLIGEPKERIRALVNWTPTDGVKHYDMIVVGLEQDHGGRRRSGRVGYISARHLSRGIAADVKTKTIMRLPGKPIYAVCPMGMSSLIIAAGNELILHNLDLDSRTWTTISRLTLPSSPISIETQGSLILVATSHHSVLVVRNVGGELVLHGSDLRARNGTCVINFAGSSMLLSTASEKGTRLIGYHDYAHTKYVKPMFEATLPLIIDQVKEINAAGPRQVSRHHFQASTTDGTLYCFTVIKPEAWKLLRFVERLSPSELVPSPRRGAKLSQVLKPRAKKDDTGGDQFEPLDMHIKGDVLLPMVEDGPYHLRNLLGRPIKTEDGMSIDCNNGSPSRNFQKLAIAVVGDSEDLVGAVIIWLRKLLRVQT